MGKGEFAFTPDGNIFSCERLIGFGTDNEHCIGNVKEGLNLKRLPCYEDTNKCINAECQSCGLKDYCMNWCGCSNYFSTGNYSRVGPFLCASEKTAIKTAFYVFQTLEEKLGSVFSDHLTGSPAMNSAGIFLRR
jgi:uncharacterized protein